MNTGVPEDRPSTENMTLQELDKVIARSQRRSSPFAKKLFRESSLDAAGVQQLINRRKEVTVAVVTERGYPHAVLVVAGCVDGRILFSASAGSLLLDTLGHHRSVASTCSTEDGSGVMIRGIARQLGHYSELKSLRSELDKLETRGYFLSADWNGFLYQLSPTAIFGELLDDEDG